MNYSEDQFRMMVDKIPALAWSCRSDGTTEFLNQRWLDYTGLSAEKALGWGWKIAIHPEDVEKLMDNWLRLLASGEPGEEEARLRRFDGEYRWFLFRVVPIRDEQDKVVRWYGTNTDIEDRKRAESLLAAEKRSLEMIASGAHDVGSCDWRGEVIGRCAGAADEVSRVGCHGRGAEGHRTLGTGGTA
jgi:PAS domain S-box-containing protein